MPFWSTNFGEDATLKDPKRNHRFIVEFGGINATPGGAVAWYAKSAAKPSFNITSAEHNYLGHKFYYPGSVTWNPISITMVDPVDPDMSATFSDIITQGGYAPPTDTTSLGTISKAKAAAALGSITVTQLDSDGNPLETWTLWNPFIEDIKYGDSLDYGNVELTEITISLKYDWARIETTNDSKAVSSGGREFFKV
jgi:hypothetical protein